MHYYNENVKYNAAGNYLGSISPYYNAAGNYRLPGHLPVFQGGHNQVTGYQYYDNIYNKTYIKPSSIKSPLKFKMSTTSGREYMEQSERAPRYRQ